MSKVCDGCTKRNVCMFTGTIEADFEKIMKSQIGLPSAKVIGLSLICTESNKPPNVKDKRGEEDE